MVRNRILAGVCLVSILLTQTTLAYNLTTTDTAIVEKLTTQIEKLITQKWESNRQKIIDILKAKQIKSSERISAILGWIIDNLGFIADVNDLSNKLTDSKPTTKITNTNLSQTSTDTINTIESFKLNTPFKLGKWQYTIKWAHTFKMVWTQDKDSDFIFPQNGQFLLIWVSYTNTSTENVNNSWLFTLKDWNNLYKESTKAAIYGLPQFNSIFGTHWDIMDTNYRDYHWPFDIPAGKTREFVVGFDVPSKFSDDAVVTIDDLSERTSNDLWTLINKKTILVKDLKF